VVIGCIFLLAIVRDPEEFVFKLFLMAILAIVGGIVKLVLHYIRRRDICPYCSAQLSRSARFCPHCHTALGKGNATGRH